MTELEFQLRASDLLETVKKIQRDYAGLRVIIEELVTALRADAEMWQSRHEAERRDRVAEPADGSAASPRPRVVNWKPYGCAL